jgi:hypothetical protein
MNKSLTEAQLSTLRVNKIIAELKMTKAELAIDKAVEELLEARRNYATAFALLTAHEAETNRQQTEATTESTTP